MALSVSDDADQKVIHDGASRSYDMRKFSVGLAFETAQDLGAINPKETTNRVEIEY